MAKGKREIVPLFKLGETQDIAMVALYLASDAAEREAVSAAEKAERKLQLRDKEILPQFFQKRKEEMERLEKDKQAEIRSYKGLDGLGQDDFQQAGCAGSKNLQEPEEDFM